MSADNGVYILKCKDQYRVKHDQEIENLWWNGWAYAPEVVPCQIVRYFGDCKYTRNSDMAIGIALKILKDMSVCEYGIRIIPCDMTWEEVERRGLVQLINKVQKDSRY